MLTLTDPERQLLERLAAEGKATPLLHEELGLAKALEKEDLLFLVGTTAVVTPRGRRILADLEKTKPSKKKPLGFFD